MTTVNKITSPPKNEDIISKINEIIDNSPTTATPSSQGLVQPDNTSIAVDGDGTLNVINTRFDSGWVTDDLVIYSESVSGTVLKINHGNYHEVDLSNYLPNDNYIYEVQLLIYGYTDTTSGHVGGIDADGFVTTHKVIICAARTRSSSNVVCAGNGNVLISTARKLRLYGAGSNGETSISSAVINGYRRVGTNT